MEDVSIEQIITWILDEASKTMPLGFSCRIGTEENKKQRTLMLQYRTRRKYYEKLSSFSIYKYLHKFSLFRLFEGFIYTLGDKFGKAFYDDLIGECMAQEMDNIDQILIYPDRALLYLEKLIKMEGDDFELGVSFEKVIRDLVKHEIRHAKQFVECRKEGISANLALYIENRYFDYGEGPLEKDALYVQFHNDEERTLSEVVQQIKTIAIKKGLM